MAEGQQLTKSTYFVMCILTNAHFVAARNPVEPTDGERIYLFLKETVVQSELGSHCALNSMWGLLIA